MVTPKRAYMATYRAWQSKIDLLYGGNLINVLERTGFRNLTLTSPGRTNKYSVRWERRGFTERENSVIPPLAPSLSPCTREHFWAMFTCQTLCLKIYTNPGITG